SLSKSNKRKILSNAIFNTYLLPFISTVSSNGYAKFIAITSCVYFFAANTFRFFAFSSVLLFSRFLRVTLRQLTKNSLLRLRQMEKVHKVCQTLLRLKITYMPFVIFLLNHQYHRYQSR